eukprot:jgi/Mesvir1/8062/Mv01480-RA.1
MQLSTKSGRAAVAANCSLYVLFQFGQTLLHHAAANGHRPLIDLLADEGAALNTRDELALNTPLHKAARAGHVDVVRRLIECGAALDAENKTGNRPLHEAAECGHEAVVTLLLDRGAQVDAANKVGLTPLIWACWQGHERVVAALFARGASIGIADEDEERPLHYAAQYGHVACVRLLLSHGAVVDARERKQQMTALHKAAQAGHQEVVEMLLDTGASVHAAEEYGGWTPLHLAAYKGHLDVAEVLLSQGAPLNRKDQDGRTPFELAADPAVKELLSSWQRRVVCYSAKEISDFAQGFREEGVLGEDDLYISYRGMDSLRRTPVLVKRLVPGASAWALHVFDKELEAYTALSDPHFLRLVGYCREEAPAAYTAGDGSHNNNTGGGDRCWCLVYEWAAHGCVEDRLAGRGPVQGPLSWQARLSIAVQVASAVHLLHATGPAGKPFLHGALTSSVVMLSEDDSARLGGSIGVFPLNTPPATGPAPAATGAGAARAAPKPVAGAGGSTVTRSQSVGAGGGASAVTSAAATMTAAPPTCITCGSKLAYLDPVYGITGKLAPASDVYALGVLLMELLTGCAPLLVFATLGFAWQSHGMS